MTIPKIGSDPARPEGPAGPDRGAAPLKQLDTEELRRRIAGGFYDDPQVAEMVALRLLESGDLDPL
jgi:hypothetical protein